MYKMLFALKNRGQGLLEYALIIALIVIVVIVALSPLGLAIKQIYTNITSSIP